MNRSSLAARVTRVICAVRPIPWTLALLLAAALGSVSFGAHAQNASVSLERTDIALTAAPESVAIGDLDGQNGKDIVVALPAPGNVGVLLNNGDGTFAPMQTYTAGPACVGLAVDITLGDVTSPSPGNRLLPDGNLDAYVACTPYVVRLTGDGTGALTNPEAFNLGVQQYLGSATLDVLALMRRPDGNPVPLLVFQHAVGSFGRQLCISYELDPGQLVCHNTPVQGPLVVGDLNGTYAGVPPDELVTSAGGALMGIFGFTSPPLTWGDSTRSVPVTQPGQASVESAAIEDLDDDGDRDVLVGQPVNSLSPRVASIHYFLWDPAGSGGLEQVPHPLLSTPGVDAVAIADVNADGRNDVVAAGVYGTGMVHLGDGNGGFDGGQDLPQIGYQNPATATRVTLAVDDLTGDGKPEIVISDQLNAAVMVYRNNSGPPPPPPPPPPDPPPPPPDPPPPPPDPPPPPPQPPTCTNPGTVPMLVGTPGDDVLVGTAGRDRLSGRGGDDCLFGGANDDLLSGGTGADLLDGSSGNDRINGDAGDDKIRGGRGNDDITPGPGRDTVAAQGGDDTINARDGEQDFIDCGAGRDKVFADRTDKVTNCEFVKRAVRRAGDR